LYYGRDGTAGIGNGDQGDAADTTKAEDAKEGVSDSAVYSYKVPVLMYHHLDKSASNNAIMTPERFEEHMAALKGAGYSAISLKQLTDYVDKGLELPENPVLITFDDGYASNYELAYPILEKYNMKAVINIIGVTVGKDTYKGTGAPIIPHFTYKEAREMAASGIIEIQSHSYDMHNSEGVDDDYRQGVNKKQGETDEEYIEVFQNDFRRSQKGIIDNIGSQVISYAYPNGFYTTLSEVLLSRMGVSITMTVDEGMNTVIKGLPQSLRAMKRYRMHEGISGDKLLKLLQQDG
jgi:peptidoglycan/xylan/chitin deacetylase (PgdA/CDA1 family)